jgi:predicted KAP-like P-loop ATPase
MANPFPHRQDTIPESADSPDAYTLLEDRPHTAVDDPLHFDALAAQLRAIIVSSQQATPLCIGLQAPWGMGKSSLMGHLARALTEEDSVAQHRSPGRGRFGRRRSSRGRDIKIVRYNAWTAEEADIQEGLVKSVLEALDQRILSRALRRKRVLSGIRIAFLIAAGWARLGPLVNAAWNTLSEDARARNEMRGLVEDAMRDWLRERSGLSAISARSPHLIVVLVDDLDRCSPLNVVKVFEAVKVYLDAPGLVFVFGYDEDVVSKAVLTAKGFSESVTSQEYLEKVIQGQLPHS